MNEDLTAAAREAMPFAALLGLEIRSVDSEKAVGSASWKPELCTVGGILHGGALMGLADCMGATLTATLLPGDAIGTTTVEAKTNFLRPVREGDVTITATPVHVGATTIVVQIDVTDHDDRLVGRSTQTQLVLR